MDTVCTPYLPMRVKKRKNQDVQALKQIHKLQSRAVRFPNLSFYRYGTKTIYLPKVTGAQADLQWIAAKPEDTVSLMQLSKQFQKEDLEGTPSNLSQNIALH